MSLDLTPLRSALAALETSLQYLYSEMAEKDEGLHEQFRAAAIQGFEFTYEITYKMIKRQLEMMSGSPSEIDYMTFMEVIRSAAEGGLVPDVARFRDYREKRNITSHTYDRAKAELIVNVLRDFVSDARFILKELERRNP